MRTLLLSFLLLTEKKTKKQLRLVVLPFILFCRRENGFPLLFHPSKQLFLRAEEAPPTPPFPLPLSDTTKPLLMLYTDRMESCRCGMNLEPRLPSSGDSGRFLVAFFPPLLRFDKSQPGTAPPLPPWCLSATADGDCDTNNGVQAGGGSVDVPQPTTTCVLNFAHQSRCRGQHARRSSAFLSEENAARCKHTEALSTLFFSFII